MNTESPAAKFHFMHIGNKPTPIGLIDGLIALAEERAAAEACRAASPQLDVFELSELPGLGFVQITNVGDENVYFTYGPDSLRGFVKVP